MSDFDRQMNVYASYASAMQHGPSRERFEAQIAKARVLHKVDIIQSKVKGIVREYQYKTREPEYFTLEDGTRIPTTKLKEEGYTTYRTKEGWGVKPGDALENKFAESRAYERALETAYKEHKGVGIGESAWLLWKNPVGSLTYAFSSNDEVAKKKYFSEVVFPERTHAFYTLPKEKDYTGAFLYFADTPATTELIGFGATKTLKAVKLFSPSVYRATTFSLAGVGAYQTGSSLASTHIEAQQTKSLTPYASFGLTSLKYAVPLFTGSRAAQLSFQKSKNLYPAREIKYTDTTTKSGTVKERLYSPTTKNGSVFDTVPSERVHSAYQKKQIFSGQGKKVYVPEESLYKPYKESAASITTRPSGSSQEIVFSREIKYGLKPTKKYSLTPIGKSKWLKPKKTISIETGYKSLESRELIEPPVSLKSVDDFDTSFTSVYKTDVGITTDLPPQKGSVYTTPPKKPYLVSIDETNPFVKKFRGYKSKIQEGYQSGMKTTISTPEITLKEPSITKGIGSKSVFYQEPKTFKHTKKSTIFRLQPQETETLSIQKQKPLSSNLSRKKAFYQQKTNQSLYVPTRSLSITDTTLLGMLYSQSSRQEHITKQNQLQFQLQPQESKFATIQNQQQLQLPVQELALKQLPLSTQSFKPYPQNKIESPLLSKPIILPPIKTSKKIKETKPRKGKRRKKGYRQRKFKQFEPKILGE